MKIYINNEEFITEEQSLKDVLKEYGMFFPCNGKGICGRCRIICHQIEPTKLDERFLTVKQQDEGHRLACDKKIVDGMRIAVERSSAMKKTRKLEFGNIAVVLGAQTASFGILDYELAEENMLANEMNEARNESIYLRSLIARESIELFERYGLAQAETIAIATNAEIVHKLLGKESDSMGDTIDAHQLMLPAEMVYMLPYINNTIGGDFVCYAALQQPDCIVIKADEDFIACLITDEEAWCLSHKGVAYQEEDLIAAMTSIKMLLQKAVRPPIFKLYGNKAHKITTILKDYTYVVEELSIVALVGSTIENNRTRSKLFKFRKKVSVLPTVESEEWQELFTLSANHRDN